MIKPIKPLQSDFFLSAFVQEVDAVPLPEETIWKIIDLLVENPFQPMVEMDMGRKNNWNWVDIQQIRKYIANRQDISITLRNTKSPAAGFTFSQNKNYTTVGANLTPEHIQEKSYHILFDFLREVADLMPDFTLGNASADSFEISDFYYQNHIPYLPDCFNGVLSWFNLLPAKIYRKYFTKQDLLSCPAFQIYEYPGELIGIHAYRNPFDFPTQEVAEKVAEISIYLNSKRIV